MNTRFWKKDWFAELAITVDGHFYAHQQTIVHRDIKPANIMYEPESDSINITDYGIAHITVSSKNKTGTIPVTPADKTSGELASQKVDGQPGFDFTWDQVIAVTYRLHTLPGRFDGKLNV